MACDYRKVEREANELLQAAGLPALDHQEAEELSRLHPVENASGKVARIALVFGITDLQGSGIWTYESPS